MNFDYYGNPNIKGVFCPLISLLKNVKYDQIWEYMGMKVTIDPTVDYNNQNVLIRWLDIDEGFNDRIIVNNLAEFNSNFNLIND